jgi:hypothetical protein
MYVFWRISINKIGELFVSFDLKSVSDNYKSYEAVQAIVPGNSEPRGRFFSSICTKVFGSIKSHFQSPAAPLNTKSKEDLTNVCVHLNEDIDTGKGLEEAVQGRCGGRLVKVVLFALLANYAGFRFFQSQTGSQPQLEPTTGVDLDLTATQLMQHINRILLSSPTLPTSNYSVSATEEVPFSQSFNTWEIFPFAEQGPLIVSTTSPLPTGVTLEQTQMQVVKSIPRSQGNLLAATNGALYIAQGGSGAGTVQIINTESFSVKKILTTGVVSGMVIVGDILYCIGNDMIVKIFNISQPFNPVALGEISSSGVGVTKISPNGIEGQLGCIAQSKFFCIDASDPLNPFVSGNVTNLPAVAYAIASSPGYYYIGTQTGLAIVNVTDSSSPTVCGFLPTGRIVDVKYLNDICYVVVITGTLLVIDVKNQTNPVLINTVNNSDLLIGLLPPSEDVMFFVSFEGMGIYSLHNKTNPVIAAPSIFSGASAQAVFQDNNVIFLGGSNINFATRRDTFRFSGTPKGGNQGNYSPLLTATTLSGQVISNQTFELDILPAIMPSESIRDSIGAVDQVFNKIINPNSFIHVNGKPLIYSLDCGSGNTLTSFIDINPVSAQLFGTPSESTVGSTACTITAKDSDGASAKSLPFNISVYYGPIISSVQNQIAIIGQPFSLKFGVTTKDSFSSNSYSTFTVSNLPPEFMLQNETIVGTPLTSDLGTYPISATVIDQNGLSKTTTFTLNVVTPGVPVFLNPLSSQTVLVGNEFSFALPLNAAVNPSNPNTAITYSAGLSDGSSLPSWISFDGTEFTGTPPRTEILFADVIYPIVLTATQKLANGETSTASTVFTITVSGTSAAKQTATYGGPLLSVLGVILAARFCCYNKMAAKPKFISCVNRTNKIFCCCFDPEAKEFHLSNEVLIERQSLKYTFKTRRSKIAKIKTFYNGEPHPELLPHWLEYNVNRRIGEISTDFVPELEGIQSIKFVATDKNGYKLEEVTFTKEVETTNDYNFSRPCQTDRKKIKAIRFFSARTEISKPSWIEYKKILNRIIAKDAPTSLKEIEPLTIYILGEDNKKLETIYINKSPNEEPEIVFDEPVLEEDEPLLQDASGSRESNESKSSSSSSSLTEMIEFKKEGVKNGRTNSNAYAEL